MNNIKEYIEFKNYKLIIHIAIPMILSNISTPLLGLMDTSIIGRVSIEQIGAIAIGSTLLSFLYFCFGFLRMGTTGLIAQAWGKKDYSRIENIIHNNLFLAIICGLICIPIFIIFIDFIIILFSDNLLIQDFTKSYIKIRIFGSPATFINFVILGILLGSNKPWFVFKLVLFINCINIILDLFLGMYLGLNLIGIAYGTVISEYFGVILGLYYINTIFSWVNFIKKRNIIKKKFNNILKSNINLFIRTALILISILMFTAIGSRLGETILAANAILLILQMFLSYSLDGFAQAAEVLVGNEYGRKNKNKMKDIIIFSGIISLVFAIFYSTIFYFFSYNIVTLITPINDIILEIQLYIPWIILSPLISFLSFHLDGVFIGANKTKIMRNTVILSFIIYLIALLILVPLYGNHGLWCSFIIFMFFRGVLLFINQKKLYIFN